MRKKVATLICSGDAVLDPKRWLAEEVSSLAVQIRHLDEIPPQALLPLAKLVADGEADAVRLAVKLDIEDAKLDEYLEALCEFKFVEQTGTVYKATPAGERAFDAIGYKMVVRQRFEISRQMEPLDWLKQRLDNP